MTTMSRPRARTAGRCPHNGKIIYRSPAQARRALINIADHRATGANRSRVQHRFVRGTKKDNERSWYRCPYCGLYHLTSLPPNYEHHESRAQHHEYPDDERSVS